MLTEQKINSIKNLIVKEFDPAAIYIFGSCANGKADEQSDLDLLVIHRTSIPNDKIGISISKALFPRDYFFDLFVLNAEEIKMKIEKNSLFWKNILKNGKKIYEQQ